jgi:hypothetical protein
MQIITDIGVKVNVRLKSEETVIGWLYGESLSGLFLGLDLEGRDIRFIPQGTWDSISYVRESPKAGFSAGEDEGIDDRVKTLESKLQRPFAVALERVNYTRLKKLKERFLRGFHSVEQRRSTPLAELETALAELLVLHRDYTELIEELSDSQILSVITENRDEIRSILSRRTLPEIDLAIIPLSVIDNMISKAHEADFIAESESGRRYLHQVSDERIIALLRERDNGNVEEDQQRERTARLSRIVAAIGRMFAGSALAAANPLLGGFTGVFTGLPTLGLGIVAAAVAIATSTYTGFNSACEGLKDLANAVD